MHRLHPRIAARASLPTLLTLAAALAGCGPAVVPNDPDGGLDACGDCLAGQVCDPALERCVTSCATTRDADGDGSRALECGGDDCADGDPAVHPGAAERCDNLDTDCNGSLDFPGEDDDGDGHGDCAGAAGALDCDDTDASAFPGAVEVCDGLDNACVGLSGEDADGDGELAAGDACMGGPLASLPRTDCDDQDAGRSAAAAEVCDGVDNDCDELVDEGTAAALGCGEGALCREGGCTTCTACAFDGSVREHWYALTVVRVPRVGMDGTLAGFNLDGVVSDGSGDVCAPADRTSPAGVPGIDNVLASIASALVPLGVDVNAGFAARLGAGEHLLLLQLLRVDGCTDDDIEVRVYERSPDESETFVLAGDGTLAPGNLLVPAGAAVTLVGSFAGARLERGHLVTSGGVLDLPETTGIALPTLEGAVLEACVGPERLEAGLLGGNSNAAAWAAATAPLGGLDPADVVGVFRAAADSLVGADEFEVQPCEGVSAGLVLGGVAGRGVRH